MIQKSRGTYYLTEAFCISFLAIEKNVFQCFEPVNYFVLCNLRLLDILRMGGTIRIDHFDWKRRCDRIKENIKFITRFILKVGCKRLNKRVFSVERISDLSLIGVAFPNRCFDFIEQLLSASPVNSGASLRDSVYDLL